jgi:CheY-like chemotaxis protein
MNYDMKFDQRHLGSVLIVEDEGLVAMMLEDLVRDMGARDVHVFADVQSARDAARTEPYSCAILDLLVRDGTTGELADILAGRDIPFIFSTGSEMSSLQERHRSRPIVIKPFADDVLRGHIRDLLAPALS